jgi:DNA modification methylase
MQDKLEVKYRKTDDLTPYEQNARIHSREQIRRLTRSMERYGFASPILVDKYGVVIAGHARLLAARKLGFKLVPTICLDELTPEQVRAYRLADNRLTELANWDEELLREELAFQASLEIDFDPEALGFSVTEVDLLLGNTVMPSPEDEILPISPTPRPVSWPGDIWSLGPNRAMCGDWLDPNAVDLLMAERLADMVLTDPPYNLPVHGHISGLGRRQHREFPMASGEMDSTEFQGFLSPALSQFARVSKDGSLHYIFMDWRHQLELLLAGRDVYAELVNLCTWVKSNGGMGSLYRSQHELVFVFKNGSAPHRNNVELGKNGRYRTNVWHYAGANAFGADRDEALAMHPTVKPVQMLADAILDVTRRGEVVLDGFLGSGSTLIAAEHTGRICYGVDLDPGYVDVSVRRWEQVTGQRATHDGTGLDIDQLAAERGISVEVPA